MADERIRAVSHVERREIGQRSRRNQHASGVHANVTRDAFELDGQLHQLRDFLFGLDAVVELRLLFDRLGQRDAKLVWNQLSDSVNLVVAHPQYPAHITNHRFRGHRPKGGDLRHRIVAVLVLHVIDHAIAPLLTKINVEVGHRYPLGVQKTLKQQIVLQRIEIGNAEGIGDQRTGARTAARPNRHAVVLCPADEVCDDQEVAGKAHLNDGLNLKLEPLRVVGTHRIALARVGVEHRKPSLEAGLGRLE